VHLLLFCKKGKLFPLSKLILEGKLFAPILTSYKLREHNLESMKLTPHLANEEKISTEGISKNQGELKWV